MIFRGGTHKDWNLRCIEVTDRCSAILETDRRVGIRLVLTEDDSAKDDAFWLWAPNTTRPRDVR